MLKKLAQKFISFKKKDENSALISVGLFIMVMAVFLIKMGNRHLPEEWKSNVEIWGTVSDWFMVVATLVTAVFLYKTLRSQMEVQNSQSIITKIELKKYLSSIKPEITFDIEKLNDEQYSLLITVSKKATVYNIKFDKYHDIKELKKKIQYSKPCEKDKLCTLKYPDIYTQPNYFIMFNYTDSDGNLYFQKNLMKMTDGVLKSINIDDSLVEPI